MYKHEDVYKASLEYFNNDDMAADVWTTKYALQDKSGAYLERTPADMHRRLAKEFARIEKKYPNPMSEDEIFELLDGFKWVIPQGSPMSGIGNSHRYQSLSNCFVIDSPYDSYGGIMMTDQEQVQIMKRRGGVGFDISRIRPRGLPTENSAKTTDGIGVFMQRFSNSCREVAQGGRRGALMLTVSCHHPEIRTFVNIKRDLEKVTGANISIRMTDEFMNAVKAGEQVQLRWPIEKRENPEVEAWVDANKLWDEIIESAHASAEPGLLFWDTATRMTPADAYAHEGFGSKSTNPCGEIILSPYDSCRLMVVNLSSFIENAFTNDAYFDWDQYRHVVMKAQRLMDNLIDLELEEVDRILGKIDADDEPDHIKRVERDLWLKIREQAEKGRRTGLGVTAVGDAVAMMNMKYGSDDSIKFVEEMYKGLALGSYMSSIDMAKERGAFPVWSAKHDAGHEFLDRVYAALPDEYKARWLEYGRRNIANTTTAPCGSVSIIAQTTSGIEPTIFLKYLRKKKVNPEDPGVVVNSVDDTGDSWMHFDVVHPGVIRWMRAQGKSEDEIQQYVTDHQTEDGAEDSPYWGATSRDIDWRAKVRMQAAAQKWVCHAISNTTNLPADISVDMVKDIYMMGWELGCKGVTIYREGSRSGVLVKEEDSQVTFIDHDAPKRPDELPCEIHRGRVDGEEWTVFVGLLEGKPYEVFGGLSEHIEIPKSVKTGTILKRAFKQGGKYDLHFGDPEDPIKIKDIVKQFDNPNYSLATRLLSTMLRHGTPVQYVVEQLRKDKDAGIFSFAKVMARTLKKFIEDGAKTSNVCGACGSKGTVEYIGGCEICTACGAEVCG